VAPGLGDGIDRILGGEMERVDSSAHGNVPRKGRRMRRFELELPGAWNVVFSLVAMVQFCVAQSPESFFPSQVGDLWQYEGDIGPRTNWQIVRDSVGADGSRYLFDGAVYAQGELPRYRIDTSLDVYDEPFFWGEYGGRRLYRLAAETGDVWKLVETQSYYGWLYSTDTTVLFGVPTIVKVFRHGPSHPDSGGNSFYTTEHHLASGFGLTYTWEEPFFRTWITACVVDGDTFGIVLSEAAPDRNLPTAGRLYQNYPNPFNPTTTIEYTLPHQSYVTLRVYNVLGEELATVVEGDHTVGTFKKSWDASALSSGVYLYRLTAGEFVQTRRMVLMK
jgi:hypothetical protein